MAGVRLLILGKQGAGKGTQAVRLSRHYVIPHIATGDMFRAAVRSGSEFGQQAKSYLDAGELVPDDVVNGVVAERLEQDGLVARGFVLDGFPRTVPQARALVQLLKPESVDVALDLEVPTVQVLARLAARRLCVDCGEVYSLLENPPRTAGICDACGGEVVQRDDDTEGAIRRRLELYERETAPLLEWYEHKDLLVRVDGSGHPDEVTDRLVGVVDARLAARGVKRPRPRGTLPLR